MRFVSQFLFLFLLLSFFVSSGQNNNIATLQKQLENKTGKAKVDLLNTLVDKLSTTDFDQAKDYAEQAYELSEELEYYNGMARSALYLGIYERDKRSYKQATKWAEKAVEAARLAKDQKLELEGLTVVIQARRHYGRKRKLMEAEIDHQKLSLERNSVELDKSKNRFRRSQDKNKRISAEKREIEETLEQTLEEKLREEAKAERLEKEKVQIELKTSELEKQATQDSLVLSKKENELLVFDARLQQQQQQQRLLIIALIAAVIFITLIWQNFRIKRAANEERLKTQQQLMVQEKMATLGQLTAGIAHEIKNPLNFVNNFAEGSTDIAAELEEVILEQKSNLEQEQFLLLQELTTDLKQNSIDIQTNGKRIDRIVQSMMDHARGDKGKRQPIDLNSLVAENLNLAYHGFKANYPDFHVNLEENYDQGLRPLEGVPQDLSRVFINVFNNACYALHHKTKVAQNGYEPLLSIRTQAVEKNVVISIKDNGEGIPDKIREKIFTPFYTTKPTGEGNTGLGLSISYDVIVQGHHGKIDVKSKEGEFTEFIISLPS